MRLTVFVLLVIFAPFAARAESVFISPTQAAVLIKSGGAHVLDARGSKARAPYLPGAVTIDWFDYRDGMFRTGRLDDDLGELKNELEALGVNDKQTMLVYGDMGEGWGEEGRIWWMLRYLGHPKVLIIDGGVGAWRSAGLPVGSRPKTASRVGRFSVAPDRTLRRQGRQVLAAMGKKAPILDTRTPEEFAGGTPYWSKRGGHIRGATNLYWKKFIGPNGKLKSAAAIKQLVGLEVSSAPIAYCTGGVRSAFVVAALRHAGYHRAANYDGSWWEWAASDNPIE